MGICVRSLYIFCDPCDLFVLVADDVQFTSEHSTLRVTHCMLWFVQNVTLKSMISDTSMILGVGNTQLNLFLTVTCGDWGWKCLYPGSWGFWGSKFLIPRDPGEYTLSCCMGVTISMTGPSQLVQQISGHVFGFSMSHCLYSMGL